MTKGANSPDELQIRINTVFLLMVLAFLPAVLEFVGGSISALPTVPILRVNAYRFPPFYLASLLVVALSATSVLSFGIAIYRLTRSTTALFVHVVFALTCLIEYSHLFYLISSEGAERWLDLFSVSWLNFQLGAAIFFICATVAACGATRNQLGVRPSRVPWWIIGFSLGALLATFFATSLSNSIIFPSAGDILSKVPNAALNGLQVAPLGIYFLIGFFLLPSLNRYLTSQFSQSLFASVFLLLTALSYILFATNESIEGYFVVALLYCAAATAIPASALFGDLLELLSRQRETEGRAFEAAREALKLQTQLRKHTKILLALTKVKATNTLELRPNVETIVESVAETLDIERVGVWLFSADRKEIRCVDAYDRRTGKHAVEPPIRASDYPEYFRSLEEERVISVEDALRDPRTKEFTDTYLIPHSIVSMLDAPIWAGGKVIGIVCHESIGRARAWTNDEEAFATSIADLLAVAVETTERLRTEAQLRYRVQFEKLLLGLAGRFLAVHPEKIDEEVMNALREIGEFCEIDRAYVFLFSEDGLLMSNTHEWCTDGVSSSKEYRQDIPVDSMPWITKRLRQGETVILHEIDELPPQAALERATFSARGIRSLLWVPLMRNDRALGFAGFTSLHKRTHWTDESAALLRVLGDMLVNVMMQLDERRRLEGQVRHVQKLESLGVLAGGIAHDFNNLLMGVLGNAGLALLDLPESSPVRRRLDQIKKTTERAAELTNQLLAYSGKGKFILETIELPKLVQEMGSLLQTVMSKRATLTFQSSANVPQIDGDPSQIRQIVMNLITNASDALEDRNGSILVSIGELWADHELLASMYLNDSLPEGRYVSLEVSDDGCGMDQKTIERIFDPFFSTKFTGRGLGLAAVLGIVRGHKGAIRVSSEIGKGTTFQILLPSRASAIDAKAQALQDTSVEKWRGSGTVLVVDDEETSRDVAHDILEHFGFTVITASNGEEGLQIYKEKLTQLSAVLLDMTMPNMDGKETASAMKSVHESVPIILTSGYTESEARDHIRGQVAGFIQKPFTPLALIEKIRSVIVVAKH